MMGGPALAVDSVASCGFREVCTPRTALVVGLGKTGLSCVEHLNAKGVMVSVVDSRATPPALDALRARFPGTRVRCGGFDPQCFEGAELIVASPGVSLREAPIAAAAARGTPVIGDIELFARAVDAPVVAVTGSNGKSTVASMVGEMARHSGIAVLAGANLGEPALSLLGRGAELYVLELSSFQLERTFSLRPAAAVVLNVAPDHLDRYRSIDEYADAKRRVYEHASVAVVNLGDFRVRSMVAPQRRRIAFSLDEPGEGEFGLSGIGDGAWLAFGKKRLMRAERLPLAGRHNVANALAALALGRSVNLPFPIMLEALRAFRGLAHRCELVADRGGVRWYNDSKATNVGADACRDRRTRPGGGAGPDRGRGGQGGRLLTPAPRGGGACTGGGAFRPGCSASRARAPGYGAASPERRSARGGGVRREPRIRRRAGALLSRLRELRHVRRLPGEGQSVHPIGQETLMRMRPQAQVRIPREAGESDGATPLIDYPLLVASLALLGLGMVMVASASLATAAGEEGAPFHYFIRHCVYAGGGVVAALIAASLPLALWARRRPVVAGSGKRPARPGPDSRNRPRGQRQPAMVAPGIPDPSAVGTDEALRHPLSRRFPGAPGKRSRRVAGELP